MDLSCHLTETQRVTIRHTTMIHVFLEFSTYLASLPQQQIRLAQQVGGLKRPPNAGEASDSQLRGGPQLI
jgi:hypothetical protein